MILNKRVGTAFLILGLFSVFTSCSGQASFAFGSFGTPHYILEP